MKLHTFLLLPILCSMGDHDLLTERRHQGIISQNVSFNVVGLLVVACGKCGVTKFEKLVTLLFQFEIDETRSVRL